MMSLHERDDKRSWRGGDVEWVRACPACGESERGDAIRGVFDNLRPGDDDQWTYWRCSRCQSLFPDPRPAAACLHAAYEQYYTHDPDERASASATSRRSVVGRLVDGYMSRRFGVAIPGALKLGFAMFSAIEPLRLKLDYHGRHLYLSGKRHGRVLDVGSGNGEFLARAAELGWDAWGIDPDDAAVAACRAQGLSAVQGFAATDALEVAAPFDVVTLRHSIEHVGAPLDDLRACLKRLHPGGMLWLAWPNPRGPGARLFRAAWRGLEAPRHLCIPSAKGMRGLLAEAGFTGVRVIRRGHHARSICHASAHLAQYRPGWVNKLRSRLGGLMALYADLAATFGTTAGDELVFVAFAPGAE